MTNNKAKGNNAQREFAKQYLKPLGIPYEIVRNTRFNHGDYFGIADILAHTKTHWIIIQVKSNTSGGALKRLKNSIPLFPPNTLFWVVSRYDGNAHNQPYWMIYEITESKTIKTKILIPKSI
jgi:hypothetical protein